MREFFFGFCIGGWVVAIIVILFPAHITSVENYLVKEGHGYYNPKTGDFTLKECIQWKSKK